MEDTIPVPDENVIYKPCSICGRTFNPCSLSKHEKICEKTKLKPRKVFDSFQQRAKDIAIAPVKPPKQEESKKQKGKWKAQHEELIKAVRSEKYAVTSQPKEGRPQQKVIPLGYIQCPVCRRCFNHKAADRHISWCQEQLSRLPKSPASSEATMRLKARIQYRAPLPGKRRVYNVDGQRLIKSAESVKSSALRTHSSPCASKSTPNIKHVAFQQQPVLRRRSCERSTFNEAAAEVYRNSNTLPSRSSSRAHLSPNASVKFKEKFPGYNSRVSYDCYSKDEQADLFLCEESTPSFKRNENLDILRALRMQFAELQANDRFNDNNLNHKNAHFSLPSMSKKGISNYGTPDDICYGSSGSNGLLPSMNPKSSLPRMPRFCYNCGTEYPIASAKYCCECGAKRLILGPSENSSPVL